MRLPTDRSLGVCICVRGSCITTLFTAVLAAVFVFEIRLLAFTTWLDAC